MAERVDYQGDGIGLVDDKGRCAIPASLRQALAANPTPLIGAALIYVLMLFPLVRLVSRFERTSRVKSRV